MQMKLPLHVLGKYCDCISTAHMGQLFLVTMDCRHLEGMASEMIHIQCSGGKASAFSYYSSAYCSFLAKGLSQSTQLNTCFCMPIVYHSDIPSDTYYTSLIMLFCENRNKRSGEKGKGYFPLCSI